MEDMSAADFWKNFRLGEEVHIAGTFIYNGLRRFHELQLLDHSDELFEFLYDLSVGIERLLKIAVVLHEHTTAADQHALEKSLITHNHLDLLVRVRKHVSINFGKPHTEFLQLLSAFYKSLRYDRFTLDSAYKVNKEAKAVRKLLSKHLHIDFPERNLLLATTNEDQYRSFISRTVLKISRTIYKIIDDRSSKLGLYTYELRHGSKAESVFLREVTIGDEDILWKELLIFFMGVDPSTGYLKFLKRIEPLCFDPALVSDYLDCFKSDKAKAAVMDELEFHYEEMDPEERKHRLRMLRVIGAPSVYFNDDDEPLEDDDND